MSALLRAGTIRSIKEVWWDVRPHPDFGTQLDRGYRLPSQPPWVIRDSKWRASRYGLDAVVITDAGVSTAPLRDELYELFQELQPAAQRLGCADELDVLSEALERGACDERQRAVVATGGG
jgi:carboxylate-amine ligase